MIAGNADEKVEENHSTVAAGVSPAKALVTADVSLGSR
jgi:hypothetical protein